MHPSFIIFMALSLTACAVSAANVTDSDKRESHACSTPLCTKVLSANHSTYKPVLKLKLNSQLEQCY